ncbi:hypothetical protein ABT373_11130 [Streptomyces sp. NPDC000070]|uniref:hypothetical protein n=1 Tax=Streptomyces sp. NPDC000070 TaxID=3154240 RepID=UPI00332EA160
MGLLPTSESEGVMSHCCHVHLAKLADDAQVGTRTAYASTAVDCTAGDLRFPDRDHSDGEATASNVRAGHDLLATARWHLAGSPAAGLLHVRLTAACGSLARPAPGTPFLDGERDATRLDHRGKGLSSLLMWRALDGCIGLPAAGLGVVFSRRIARMRMRSLSLKGLSARPLPISQMAAEGMYFAWLPEERMSGRRRFLGERSADLRLRFPGHGPTMRGPLEQQVGSVPPARSGSSASAGRS